MCRLFGFRSVIPSQMHRSLLEADNAILHQSQVHSDGWGVAYFVGGAPHVIKSTSPAVEDRLFRRVSGILASETVLAHIRKATHGDLCITNAHPFQYGHWVFIHNGNMEGFEKLKGRLLKEVSPLLRRFILGNTDSEVLFYTILTRLSRRIELHRGGCCLADLAAAVRESVAKVTEIIGPFHLQEDGPPEKTYLTFILTDGSTMIAHQGGKPLYYSTYKSRCQERGSCPCFAFECENPTQSGYVNHLLFSSEPIRGENIWLRAKPGQLIGVDRNMKLEIFDTDAAVGSGRGEPCPPS